MKTSFFSTSVQLFCNLWNPMTSFHALEDESPSWRFKILCTLTILEFYNTYIILSNRTNIEDISFYRVTYTTDHYCQVNHSMSTILCQGFRQQDLCGLPFILYSSDCSNNRGLYHITTTINKFGILKMQYNG